MHTRSSHAASSAVSVQKVCCYCIAHEQPAKLYFKSSNPKPDLQKSPSLNSKNKQESTQVLNKEYHLTRTSDCPLTYSQRFTSLSPLQRDKETQACIPAALALIKLSVQAPIVSCHMAAAGIYTCQLRQRSKISVRYCRHLKRCQNDMGHSPLAACLPFAVLACPLEKGQTPWPITGTFTAASLGSIGSSPIPFAISGFATIRACTSARSAALSPCMFAIMSEEMKLLLKQGIVSETLATCLADSQRLL